MRTPISVEEWVGLALWRIATGNSFRTCGLQFGYGKSTAKCICEEFEKALARKKDQFIQFPVTREDIQNSIDEFEEKYGIPQITGAIDGCHIEINAPPRNREDYYNRKQHYSVVLQGIVDSNLKFLHASVGYPGSIHDSRVLRLSGIYNQAESEQILSAPIRDLGGTNIRPLMVHLLIGISPSKSPQGKPCSEHRAILAPSPPRDSWCDLDPRTSFKISNQTI